jgi:hypothetical protein
MLYLFEKKNFVNQKNVRTFATAFRERKVPKK